jgi:hypothetical protein
MSARSPHVEKSHHHFLVCLIAPVDRRLVKTNVPIWQCSERQVLFTGDAGARESGGSHGRGTRETIGAQARGQNDESKLFVGDRNPPLFQLQSGADFHQHKCTLPTCARLFGLGNDEQASRAKPPIYAIAVVALLLLSSLLGAGQLRCGTCPADSAGRRSGRIG